VREEHKLCTFSFRLGKKNNAVNAFAETATQNITAASSDSAQWKAIEIKELQK